MKYAFLFVFLLLYTVSFSQSDDRVKLRDLQSAPASTSDYVIFAVNDTAGWKQITEYNGDTVIVWHPTLKKFAFIHKDSISTPLPDSLAYGTGTTNYLSRWIAPFTLGTAGITDDGSEIQFARPTVLYGVNTAAPATYGTFGIDNTLGIERPTYYNGSAWIPWLAYSGGTNQYSYFSNSNTITSGTQLTRDANGVSIGDGNYFKLPSNSTVGSMLTAAGHIEFNSSLQEVMFRNSTANFAVGYWQLNGLFGNDIFVDNTYRVGIGTTNPALIGATRLGAFASTSDAGSFALKGFNSSGAQVFSARADGFLEIGSGNVGFYPSSNFQSYNPSLSSKMLAIQSAGALSAETAILAITSTTSETNDRSLLSGQTATSGSIGAARTYLSFKPTSGTASWYGLAIDDYINQTGGASGKTCAINLVNDDTRLIAVADYAAIESNNNKGLFLRQLGSAGGQMGTGKYAFGTTNNSDNYTIKINKADATAALLIERTGSNNPPKLELKNLYTSAGANAKMAAINIFGAKPSGTQYIAAYIDVNKEQVDSNSLMSMQFHAQSGTALNRVMQLFGNQVIRFDGYGGGTKTAPLLGKTRYGFAELATDGTLMSRRLSAGSGVTLTYQGDSLIIAATDPVYHIITRTIYDGDAALPDSTVAVNGTFNAGFWRVPESMDGYTLTKASFGIFDKGDMIATGATYSFGVQKCNGSNMSCSNSSNVNFTPSSETELELSLSITLNANDILRVNYQPPQGCGGGCGTENVNGLVVTYTIQEN